MSDKYLKDGNLDLAQLQHDVSSLVEPLALSIRIMDSDKREKAMFIQKELLSKLRSIVGALNELGNVECKVSRQDGGI